MNKRKLITTSLSLMFLASTFVATTYAYVVIDKKTDVREFKFNVENSLGLLASLDGENFTQDISSDMLTSVIAGNRNYEDLSFTGVTPKCSESKVLFDDNNEIEFVKDNVVNKEHGYVDAIKNTDYISFDLYFKLINSYDTNDFNLYITNNSYISGNPVEYTLINSLTTFNGSYNTGDKINVNSANAMRVAISVIDDNINTNYYEITNDLDLGSAAVEGMSERHDPNKNAMYTYYNSCFPLYPFKQAASYNESFLTSNVFKKDDSDILGKFVYNTDYNTIHTKVYIWLEGWDSDYLLGLPTLCNSLDIKLQFEIK